MGRTVCSELWSGTLVSFMYRVSATSSMGLIALVDGDKLKKYAVHRNFEFDME